jgi:hypothetical protein
VHSRYILTTAILRQFCSEVLASNVIQADAYDRESFFDLKQKYQFVLKILVRRMLALQ